MAESPNGESCTNTQYTPGISTHLFPLEPSVRAQWVKFVRANSLASSLPGMEGIKIKRNLIPGSILTRDTVLPEGPQVLGERQKRQVSHFFTPSLIIVVIKSFKAFM